MAKKRELRVYAREWRRARGLTLEEAAPKVGLSVSYLSDLEKGSGGKRWNVDHIAALAEGYKLADPRDLFRDPARQDPLLGLVEGLSGPERETAERVLSALHRKTGSDS
jgi:transcriptional regulator with XRE-family HTH domain